MFFLRNKKNQKHFAGLLVRRRYAIVKTGGTAGRFNIALTREIAQRKFVA